MALTLGTRLGTYEILSLLGAGGMGEVYRATDTKLRRDVAIKVLPAVVANDPERYQRFKREAHLLAALNHPNIAAIYGLDEVNGELFLVLELVPGEDLAQRLKRGAVPLEEAIPIARQIAEAVEEAHEKGIVHRDLKPANIKVTPDGKVKVLDFGLAKAWSGNEEPLPDDAQELSDSPTATHTDTTPGLIIGTAAYMSPEQARGSAVDRRADIWAFGVVLFEMLSGKRAFRGATLSDTLAAVLTREPDWSALPAQTPTRIRRLLERCLERDVRRRLQAIGEARLILEGVMAHPEEPNVAPAPSRSNRATLALASAMGIALGLLGAYLTRHSSAREGPALPPTFRQLTFRRPGVPNARFTPEGAGVSNARFTRDGASVIYSAQWEGDEHSQLYAQRLDAVEPRSLTLPQRELEVELLAVGPGELAVWSERDYILSRVPLEGGVLRRVLGDVINADWSPDGTSLAVARLAGERQWIEFPIGKILYESKAGIVFAPRVSSDGKRVAFLQVTGSGVEACVVDETGHKTTLSTGWWGASGLAWSADGREVWFGGSRTGQRYSVYAVNLKGQERRVLSTGASLVPFDVSPDGRVLLEEMELVREVRGAPDGVHERSFSWLDETTLGDLSADGQNLLFSEMSDAGGRRNSVYLRKLADPMPTRLGDGQGFGLSPDGAWALVQIPGEPPQLSLVPAGVGETKMLARGTLQAIESASWFPDGRRILVVGRDSSGAGRLFIQEVPDGLPRAMTLERTAIRSLDAFSKVSPDGCFVAAARTGDLSSSFKFALFPVEGGAPVPIPGIGEDDLPIRWSRDGRFLFVRKLGGMPIRIERLDLQTGRKQPWKELRPPDLAGTYPQTVLLASDGGAYFYDFNRTRSKLYLVEGLR